MIDRTNPTQVLAATAWGENRGGGQVGMQSVLNVVMNRAALGGWWGATPLDVCLHPYQFSCWLPGADLDAMEATPFTACSFVTALGLAWLALGGDLPDITGGADSYYGAGTKTPDWAPEATFTRSVKGQLFYKTR